MKQAENNFSLDRVLKQRTHYDELREIFNHHNDETAKEFGLATLNMLTGELDAAMKHIRFVFDRRPDDPLIHTRVAEIFVMGGDYKSAAGHLEEARRLDPDDFTVFLLLAACYNRMRDKDKINKSKEYIEAYYNFIKLLVT